MERARALTDLGAMLRRRNRRTEARELLSDALDAAHRAGARALAEYAETELRATARPRRAVLTGLDLLTAGERRVADPSLMRKTGGSPRCERAADVATIAGEANPRAARGSLERRRVVMKISRFAIVLVSIVSLAVGVSAALGETHAATRGATVKTGSSSLGRIIVDARGRTVYLFEKDTRRSSACAGACATYWPPLLTHGKPTAGAGVKRSLLGVIRRANGTRQVTYAGHPLYRFALDTKPGQTNGEGRQDFGAGWDALSPAGKKIEQAASSSGYPGYPPA
jgi:predicted lipoprotein with Yx(FWY)xxD motif